MVACLWGKNVFVFQYIMFCNRQVKSLSYNFCWSKFVLKSTNMRNKISSTRWNYIDSIILGQHLLRVHSLSLATTSRLQNSTSYTRLQKELIRLTALSIGNLGFHTIIFIHRLLERRPITKLQTWRSIVYIVKPIYN